MNVISGHLHTDKRGNLGKPDILDALALIVVRDASDFMELPAH
jgi:hypothetical protein